MTSIKLRNLRLSKFGDIVFSTLDEKKVSRVHKYSVNGKLLKCVKDKDEVSALLVRGDHVLIGKVNGTLSIRGLQRFVQN